jgi:chemotaxis protein methyltransferase CheR
MIAVAEETLSARDYARLCDLIYAEAGISLNAEKKTMLEARIKRRLKALNIETYVKYCEYLFTPVGLKDEILHLIDVVTTNKTDFFREPRHFDYLTAKALPDLAERARSGKPLLVWSAGCSTGEEPYTLAIVLSEYAAAHPGLRFRIMATDISTTVLEKADRGVYTNAVVAPVPAALKRKYFLRSRNATSDLVRVVPELRKLIEFRRLNFMDADYGMTEKADAIFCRNVIIYFDRPTQERILGRLAENLVHQGYMFVGHSETLHDMHLPLIPVAPALYRKTDAQA